MAVDWHILWRIGKHHQRLLAGHQPVVRVGLRGIAAQNAMITQQPQVAKAANGGTVIAVDRIVGGVPTRHARH